MQVLDQSECNTTLRKFWLRKNRRDEEKNISKTENIRLLQVCIPLLKVKGTTYASNIKNI